MTRLNLMIALAVNPEPDEELPRLAPPVTEPPPFPAKYAGHWSVGRWHEGVKRKASD